MGYIIGQNIIRKEAFNKVTGTAKYTDDFIATGIYHADLLVSPYAHAKIISIDISAAASAKGVKKIITGNDINVLCGPLIDDKPPLAKEKVRYHGEPVVMVVADCEQNAKAAVAKIKVNFQPLPVVNSVSDALKENAVLIHENLQQYKKNVSDVYPETGSNVCGHVKIRKGDLQKGWQESELTIESNFTLPQSDHAAMETRAAQCQIMPNGRVIVCSSTQAPFSVKEQINKTFQVPIEDIDVNVLFVGGGFGGKAAVQLEILAYIAAKAVDGHTVKIASSREKDMITTPCKIGLEAKIKIGAKKNGKIIVAEMHYNVDCGGYADIAPRIAKAIAVDCAGPYNIENISCDALSVYTNHPVATSFRGFGHTSLSFCIERMMDKLGAALNIDPIEIRMINALTEGCYSPTQVKVTLSNTGNFGECLNKLKTLINWHEGQRIVESNHLIRAKGVGCFVKTSDSPTNAISGVLLTFNSDGSINLNCGAVEIGPGMKTTAAQILAEKLKMDIGRIQVKMEVDTQTSPVHWKTVASMTTYMVGRAVISAAEDLIRQLLNGAATILRCTPEDLEIAEEKIFLKTDQKIYLTFKDIVHGFQYQNGNSIVGQIMGRGNFIMNQLSYLDKETGEGKAGPYWTPGAQAVEIEYDTIQHTYRILKAATVVDAGKVLNPKTVKGILMGGMCMGLGLGTSESFIYDAEGIVQNTSFRTYKMMRYGETPDYLIDYVETPQLDAPYGSRGLAEHGIIGIPAALANAISLAAGIDVTKLPITPEQIWQQKEGVRQ